jgi:hypothetical protein
MVQNGSYLCQTHDKYETYFLEVSASWKKKLLTGGTRALAQKASLSEEDSELIVLVNKLLTLNRQRWRPTSQWRPLPFD